MVSALHKEFGTHSKSISFQAPTGGMFLWMTLTDEKFRGITSDEVFVKLAAKGVITVPGQDFYVAPACSTTTTTDSRLQFPVIRLSYAAPSIENINEGVARFAQGIKSI